MGTSPRGGGRREGRGEKRGRDARDSEFKEDVVKIYRVSKVVKGGRRFSFSAIAVVGDATVAPGDPRAGDLQTQ